MSFREIVGHLRLKRLLARAAHSGTLPPSLVFAGPEGVGKKRSHSPSRRP
jgi:DNA polymerase III delta prime subunit